MATPLLTIYKGDSSLLSDSSASTLTHDGRLYLTTDDGYLYYDIPHPTSKKFGVAAAIGTNRFAINANMAAIAKRLEHGIDFWVEAGQITNSFNGSGNGNTTVYIGSTLVVGAAANAVANGASAATSNAVYLNLLTRQGTSSTYSRKNGQVAIKLVGSGDVKVSCDAQGNITIADKTYTASGGLELNGTQIQHTNSAITAGTIAEGGSARTLAYGGKFKIPSITYNAYGHITAVTTTELTLPAAASVFTASSSSAAGKNGLVPGPGAGIGATAYLNASGAWTVPPNTHYVTHLFVNGATAAATHITSAVTNGNVHLRLYDSIDTTNTVREAIKLQGAGALTITVAANDNTSSSTTGKITFTAVNNTYEAGSGIKVTQNGQNSYASDKYTIAHTNILDATGSVAGTADGTTLTVGGTFKIPKFNYDLNGHLTTSGQNTLTLPSVMSAASASSAGTAGFVPAPGKGKHTAFLRGDGTWEIPTDTNTHYTTKMFINSDTATKDHASTVADGHVYLRLYDDDAVESTIRIIGSDATSVTVDTAGIIKISSHNTTYDAEKGISLSNGKFGHTNAAITPSSLSASVTSNLNDNDSISIPLLKYDGYGHIVGSYTNTLTFSAFQGASSGGNGKKGLVPAPTQNAYNNGYFLSASGTWEKPSYIPDTHYTTMMYVSDLQTATSANSLANDHVYITLFDNSTYRTRVKLVGATGQMGNGVTVTSAENVITFTVGLFKPVNTSAGTASVAGLVPAASDNNSKKYLCTTGEWTVPENTTYTFTDTYNASTNPAATKTYAQNQAQAKYNAIEEELNREDAITNETTGVVTPQIGYQMSTAEVDAIFDEVFL